VLLWVPLGDINLFLARDPANYLELVVLGLSGDFMALIFLAGVFH
jgi:hypothetical protein